MKSSSFVIVSLAALAFAAERSAGGADSLAYTNPLAFTYESHGKQHSELRDPCIVREGARYTVVFTMHPFSNRDDKHFGEPDMGGSPGIRAYSTVDFKNWKDDGWLVKSSALPEDCPYKHQFWAPEIHQFGGKFYLIFTASNWNAKQFNLQEGYYAFIGVADHAAGPYEHITKIPNGPCDTTLFSDEQGAFYLAMPRKDIAVQQVDLSDLAKGVIRRVGKESLAVNHTSDDLVEVPTPDYLEGPWVERINGKFHLFYAEAYKEGYWTGVATADRPLGPYTKDPRGKVFFGGHLGVFDGPDGRKWFSYRQERHNDGRGLLCIDPFAFDAQGKFVGVDTFKTEVTVRLKP